MPRAKRKNLDSNDHHGILHPRITDDLSYNNFQKPAHAEQTCFSSQTIMLVLARRLMPACARY
ncbi:MAG: hypothetical protein CMF39_02995 [Legionellaceae bacterium]|nr:hypothetical protein [Legionellaceae bacterium]